MKRGHIKFVVVGAVILGFAALIAFQFSGGVDYAENVNGLKGEFNRDQGKVRLLVLLSPT
jgi:hypothetical protein